MQTRILQPGEIESLAHTSFPRILLPQPQALFGDRTARLQQLAEGNPIADYLRLLARLVQAQKQAASTVQTTPVAPETIERQQEFSMPLMPAADHIDPAWQKVLTALLDQVQPAAEVPAALLPTLDALRQQTPQALDALAQRVLSGSLEASDLGTAPFVAAALQVVFADRASRLDVADVPYTDPGTICPVCASQPVASVLRIGGNMAGHRYLHCGVCCTEWHMVRVKCSHCESTTGVRYQGMQSEGGDQKDEVVLAETCDQCHTYRKIANQEKDPLAEPLADDLATLLLDLLMGETPFARASMNPLLPMSEAEEGAAP